MIYIYIKNEQHTTGATFKTLKCIASHKVKKKSLNKLMVGLYFNLWLSNIYICNSTFTLA